MQLLTHYHSDHTSGVPDVWLTGWLESHFGTRKTPYRVIGPTGARELMENLERAYALDIKIRVADEKLPLSGIAIDVTEFDRDGVVYVQGGVKVIAFEVDHGDATAVLRLSLRIRRPGRGVLLRHPLQSKRHQATVPAPTCWSMRLRARRRS